MIDRASISPRTTRIADRRGALILALTGLLSILACVERNDSNSTVAATDTSTSVANNTIRIDGTASELVPFLPASVAIAQDGTLYIPQQQVRSLRAFAPTGELVGSLGRDGAGPGEFRSVNRAGTIGDSLWVWDGRLLRISIFVQSTLELHRTVGVNAQLTARNSSNTVVLESFSILGVSLGDTIVAYGGDAARDVVFRTSLSDTRDGHILATVVMARDVRKVRAGNVEMEADLLPNLPFVTVTPRADMLIIARGRIESENSGTVDILGIRMTGDTAFARSSTIVLQPFPATVADSLMEARSQGLPGPLAAAFRRDAAVPQAFPPLVAIAAAWDGSIWLQLYEAERTVLRVLDAGGDSIGTATLPRGVLAGVSSSHVWLVERDVNDVQSLVGYPRILQ